MKYFVVGCALFVLGLVVYPFRPLSFDKSPFLSISMNGERVVFGTITALGGHNADVGIDNFKIDVDQSLAEGTAVVSGKQTWLQNFAKVFNLRQPDFDNIVVLVSSQNQKTEWETAISERVKRYRDLIALLSGPKNPVIVPSPL